jgi:hypothetical protein
MAPNRFPFDYAMNITATNIVFGFFFSLQSSLVELHFTRYILYVLSYDPNSVFQEKGRLLTERSGGLSPVGLGRSEAVRVINTR